ISDPNIAYILMMIGLAGIYFELSHPGAIFPGVIGGISLILAFYSFQTLPVNYAGLLLIILSVALFILEIKVQSYGMLSLGGILSLVLGSIMLFEDLRVSLKLLIPTVLGITAFFVIVTGLAIKAVWRRPLTGKEGLVGEVGVAKTSIAKQGKVFVHGEYWNAQSEEPIGEGEKVVVIGMEGLLLKVKKKE
ncbi:MAG: NfeD family protein, partial [Desulfatiglandales bacterium]